MGLNYYADMNDAPVFDLLRQASIKTENHLMDFSYYSCQYCPYNGRSTGEYMIFYQGGTIDHGAYVTGPVAQSSKESEYNSEFTSGMALAHFRILFHILLNKDLDIVKEKAYIIILGSNSNVCMYKNGKNNKNT